MVHCKHKQQQDDSVLFPRAKIASLHAATIFSSTIGLFSLIFKAFQRQWSPKQEYAEEAWVPSSVPVLKLFYETI